MILSIYFQDQERDLYLENRFLLGGVTSDITDVSEAIFFKEVLDFETQ